MKKFNTGIDNLSNEILEFKKDNNNSKNSIIEKVILISTIIIMTVLICLTDNLILIFISSSLLFSSTTYYITKKNIDKNKIDEFTIRRYNNDYYTEEYKELLNSPYESIDEKKFREVYQQQQQINTSNNILNKNETMKRLVYEIDIILDAYDIEDIEISNREWDIYFDILYKEFKNKNIESKFYQYMNYIIRLIIAKTLVAENESIITKDFVDGVEFLDRFIEFDENDITNIKDKLNNYLNTNNIIKIDDYKKRLTKK